LPLWLCASLWCPLVQAEELIVSPLGVPLSLADALLRAKDGDVIEVLPGDYRGVSVVLENRKLKIMGVGKRPVMHGDGQLGASKALLLIKGGEVTIENLEFRGARSAEGEGAGVRLEGGKLTVRRSAFYDNEYGLLALNDENAELTIEDSEFGLAPKVVGGQFHLLNVGRIGKLDVSGSRFQQGFEGHLIKSRARESRIAYNFIHDGSRGGASYEIEIASGGLATLIGNVIGQGSQTQNPVMVAYGTDKKLWDKNALLMSHNTLINNGWTPAWFVRVISKNLPAATEVLIVNNLLVGTGLLWPAVRGQLEGNRYASRGMLRDADTYAFELPLSSMWRGSAIEAQKLPGRDLSPKGEFDWPVGVKPIQATPGRWSPGAYQR